MSEENKDFSGMYDTIEAYIHKRDNNLLALKEGAKEIQMNNIITGNLCPLPILIGYLISEYKRLTDVIDGYRKFEYWKEPRYTGYQEANMRQFKVSTALLQAIEYAYAMNLVEEKPAPPIAGLNEKISALESDLLYCREQNKKLRANLEGLQKLLGTYESTVERGDAEDEKE
jgi:hypothetical protein